MSFFQFQTGGKLHRRHDSQHNDTRPNDAQHNNTKWTFSVTTFGRAIKMRLSAQHFAERRCTECCYDECRGAAKMTSLMLICSVTLGPNVI
jgi:hypothetical protein